MNHAESWDQRYAAAPRLFSHEADTAMIELVTPLTPGRAVDLGAGEGRNSLWLARRGWRVTAVDQSSVALERLRSAAAAEGLPVTPRLGDIHAVLAGGETYDLVLVANIHPPAEERTALLLAATRAVARGGHLLVVGHHVDALGRVGPLDTTRLYTEEALAGSVPGLRILSLERRERTHGGDTGELVVDVVLWAAAPGEGEPERGAGPPA